MVHHLAQVNIALPREPLTSPLLAGFVAALDRVNALADASPGFIWRLQTEAGDATAVHGFEDDRLIINLTVWESVEAMADFVFRSAHAEVMRRRRSWFEQLREAYTVLWWVPAGHVPTVQEAEERLARLRALGPTPEAFSLREPYGPPEEGATPRLADADDRCPA
jgi:heme-degrading monooxygenase HmoA